MATKFTFEAVKAELGRVIEDRTLVPDQLTVLDACLIMQTCQLSVTHPTLSLAMIERLEALGRRMQELVRPHVSAFFAEFMEAGWHREYDE